MLANAPTVESLTAQCARAEVIAQSIARQRDNLANALAVAEAELAIERDAHAKCRARCEALEPKTSNGAAE